MLQLDPLQCTLETDTIKPCVHHTCSACMTPYASNSPCTLFCEIMAGHAALIITMTISKIIHAFEQNLYLLATRIHAFLQITALN